MKEMLTYKTILEENRKMKEAFDEASIYSIQVLSNITVNQIVEPLAYFGMKNGINAKVTVGDYDNIILDATKAKEYKTTIVFWELCNIIEGFHFKSEVLSAAEIESIANKVKAEIQMTYENLKGASLVIWNKFSSMTFTASTHRKQNLDVLAEQLNAFLEETLPEGFFLIDLDKVIAQIGTNVAVDHKFFHLFKSLYSQPFFIHYAESILPLIKANKGQIKKVLILDCDNTLWNGVIGEDGMDGIQMSYNSKKGAPFAEIQTFVQSIFNKGILLCLCSKNNENDVADVFSNHEDMSLKWDDFIVKKINWQDKATNIKEIASELNLGLDACVFVDDSDFEVNLVRESLPMVTTYQVPKQLYQYPLLFRKIKQEFFSLLNTKEDGKKHLQYKQEQKRNAVKNEYSKFEDYLKDLALEVDLFHNHEAHTERIAQMTQKTNQFNLLTKRYSVLDIETFLKADDYSIFTFSVKDKYGDYGVTGLYIIQFLDATTCTIDTLLMSCRVIGRKIEYAVFNELVDILKNQGIQTIHFDYSRTKKNVLVEQLGEDLGLQLTQKDETIKKYLLNTVDFKGYGIDYIKFNKEQVNTFSET